MKNILKLTSLLILGLLLRVAHAQETMIHNIYENNHYLFNPASTGSFGHTFAFLNIRDQWSGFDGAPKTRFLGLHTMLDANMGLGGSIMSYKRGIMESFGVNLAYSYKVDFDEMQNLTFGISGGFINRQLLTDAENFRTDVAGMNDALELLDTKEGMSFDAGIGLKYKIKNFQLDLAAPQLFDHDYNLAKHFVAMASYDLFMMENRLMLEPSLAMRTLTYTGPQLDMNVIGEWNKKFWGGVSYRTLESSSLIFQAGIRQNNLCVGYAYEVNTGGTSTYKEGSFEIVLAYHFDKVEKELIDYDQVAEDTLQVEEEMEEMLSPEELQKRLDEYNMVRDEETNQYFNDGTLTLDDSNIESGNYVIIHTFQEFTNVRTTVNLMREKGVKGFVMYNKTKKRYYIYTHMYSNLELALEMMKQLRTKGFKAWVLIY